MVTGRVLVVARDMTLAFFEFPTTSPYRVILFAYLFKLAYAYSQFRNNRSIINACSVLAVLISSSVTIAVSFLDLS
jgi:hypothetical protein